MDIANPGCSKHHLFTYHEIKARLVEVFGDPQCDSDHEFLQDKVKLFHGKMETYGLSFAAHEAIHNQKNRR